MRETISSISGLFTNRKDQMAGSARRIHMLQLWRANMLSLAKSSSSPGPAQPSQPSPAQPSPGQPSPAQGQASARCGSPGCYAGHVVQVTNILRRISSTLHTATILPPLELATKLRKYSERVPTTPLGAFNTETVFERRLLWILWKLPRNFVARFTAPEHSTLPPPAGSSRYLGQTLHCVAVVTELSHRTSQDSSTSHTSNITTLHTYIIHT